MAFNYFNVYPTLTPARLVSLANVVGNYFNGPGNLGVGSYLLTASSTLSLDGVAVVNGDRVLIASQTSGYQNGLYNVSGVGSAVLLTRTNDLQCIEQVHSGLSVSVSAGSTSSGDNYVITDPLPGRFGVDNLTFTSRSSITPGLGTAAAKDTTDNAEPLVAAVSGATVVGHLAIFADTLGTIEDGGATPVLGTAAAKNASDNAQPTVASVSGATSLFDVLVAADAFGTVRDSAGVIATAPSGLQATAGNIIAGSSGNQGAFISFPPGATLGKLFFQATNNGVGNFDVTLTNANNIGQNTTFNLQNPGVASTNLIMSNSTAAQHIASGGLTLDTGNFAVSAGSMICSGTIQSTAGNIFSRSSLTGGTAAGVAGNLTLYPGGGVGGVGFLQIQAGGNTGNTSIIITNEPFGQASLVEIPDPGVFNAHFALVPTTLVVGNLVQASGVAGLIQDSGTAMKKVHAAAVNAVANAVTITDAFCTATSVVVGNWVTQAVSGQISTIVPGNGTFVVNSNATVGVATFSYIIMK